MEALELTYEEQALKFLDDTDTEYRVEFSRHDVYFDEDKEKRDIYWITLQRGSREFTFEFGQSLQCSMEWLANTIYAQNAYRYKNEPRLTGSRDEVLMQLGLSSYDTVSKDLIRNPNYSEPTAYDVLACLTKYPVDSFEDFCCEYGYDEDSRKAYRIYEAVKNEWQNVAMLWNDDELEELREIQ